MASYRIEAELHPALGKYFAKLFYPSDAVNPVATTAPIYDSESEAMRRIEEMFTGKTEPVAQARSPDNSS